MQVCIAMVQTVISSLCNMNLGELLSEEDVTISKKNIGSNFPIVIYGETCLSKESKTKYRWWGGAAKITTL